MRAMSIYLLILLVLSCTMPVNAINNSNLSMDIVYIGHNISHDSFTGGYISKNIILEKYIPNTDLTDKIISIGKFGTPMITIGNGSQPKVMLITGVHGNELPAQIAAIEMINYLKNKNINGTVYIIPVVSP
jgi:predicted deacylase